MKNAAGIAPGGVFSCTNDQLLVAGALLQLVTMLHIFLVAGLVALAAGVAVIKIVEAVAVLADLVPIRVIQNLTAGNGQQTGDDQIFHYISHGMVV
jgi:hypothetical protein